MSGRGERLQRLPYLRSALAVAAVLILAGDLYLLGQKGGTPASVDNVVERFRQEPGVAGDKAQSPPTTVAETATTTSRPPTPSTTATTPPRSRPAADAAGAAPAPEASRPATLLRPPAGVYRYQTAGSESLSLPGATRRYPGETTRTVRHGPGCTWSMRLVLVVEHQEEHFVCSTTSTLVVTGSTTHINWFGFSSTVNVTCDPPFREADRAAAPGTSTPFVCRQGGESTFSGTTTIGGQESVIVEGQARRAWRVVIRGTFEGSTRGTVSVTELVDQENGMVLFEQRSNDLVQRSVLGDVGYRQEVTLTLSSLTPRT